ncbi:MAG: ABC transporter substrate-binding protein [Candidatus Nitrosocosmicus sp.]
MCSFIITLFVFSSSIFASAQSTNRLPSIKVGTDLWIPNFLAYIAQEKGYFKINNVDVNFTLIPSYSDVINSYSNGNFDGIFAVYSDVIVQQSEGINSKVVYASDSSSTDDVIVGKENNLLDVKGKNVGIDDINSFSHLFVLKSLEKIGLSEGDVQFVIVPVQNVSEAIQKGKIVAGYTHEPFINDAIKKGFKVLSTANDIPGLITTVLIFHSDIVQQRPQDIQNIVKSLAEAKMDYEKNKEQDIAIMSQKSGLTKEKIIQGMNNTNLSNLTYNYLNVMNKNSNQTASLYKTGNDIVKFYAGRGIISEYPNIDDLIDPQFVNALSKEDNVSSFQ